MKKMTNAIVKEDIDEIGPFCGLHVEIPVEGFKVGDLVTVTYSITKAKDAEDAGELDDSMYLKHGGHPMTVDDCMEFFTRHRMH